jgi:hypothetical protein
MAVMTLWITGALESRARAAKAALDRLEVVLLAMLTGWRTLRRTRAVKLWHARSSGRDQQATIMIARPGIQTRGMWT